MNLFNHGQPIYNIRKVSSFKSIFEKSVLEEKKYIKSQ